MQAAEIDLAKVIDRIDANWKDFRVSYAGLNDEDMMTPGSCRYGTSWLTWLPGTPTMFAANDAFRKRLAADTWNHYPEHAAAIRAWREGRS